MRCHGYIAAPTLLLGCNAATVLTTGSDRGQLDKIHRAQFAPRNLDLRLRSWLPTVFMGVGVSSCERAKVVVDEIPAIEGWLGKRGILLGSLTMKNRYFVLDGRLRLLDIYEKPGGDYLGCIDLNGSVAVQLSQEVPRGMDIVSPERVFELVAPTQSKASEWVTTLQKLTVTSHVLLNPIMESGKVPSGRVHVDDLAQRCRTGDVILFYDKDPGAKFIHTFTASKWNHVGWARPNWARPNWARPNWARPNWARPNWARPNP